MMTRKKNDKSGMKLRLEETVVKVKVNRMEIIPPKIFLCKII